MKKVTMMFLCLSFVFTTRGQEKTTTSDDVSRKVIRTDNFGFLVGKTSCDSTNVIMQKDGNDTGFYGRMVFVSSKEDTGENIYSCGAGGPLFYVGNDYRMAGGVLRDSDGKFIEAVTVDESIRCSHIGVIFPKVEEILTLELENIEWLNFGYSLTPFIESSVINTADPSKIGYYTLAIKCKKGGQVSKMFTLELDEILVDSVKKSVYKVSNDEVEGLSTDGKGNYFFNQQPIEGFVVLKMVNPPKKDTSTGQIPSRSRRSYMK